MVYILTMIVLWLSYDNEIHYTLNRDRNLVQIDNKVKPLQNPPNTGAPSKLTRSSDETHLVRCHFVASAIPAIYSIIIFSHLN